MKTNVDLAAELLGRLKGPRLHGQMCPVLTAKAPISKCDCWILANARDEAEALARANLIAVDAQ